MKIRILVSLLVLFSALFTQSEALAHPDQQAAAGPGSLVTLIKGQQISEGEDGKMTPDQESLKKSIEERKAKNLPVPDSVKFTYEESPIGRAALTVEKGKPAPLTKTIKATTVIDYANPQQAGYDAWPTLEIKPGDLPDGSQGTNMAGDYTDQVHQKILEKFPWFDAAYTFGQEPRRITITEEMTATYPEPQLQLSSVLSEATAVTTSGKILMGTNKSGPHISTINSYDTGFCVDVPIFGEKCVNLWQLKTVWQLDWNDATRLPGEVTITGPASVPLGSTGDFSAYFTGENWSAQQYTDAGVEPFDGNEYNLGFSLTAGVALHFGDPDPNCPGSDDNLCKFMGLDIDLNKTDEYTTPLGPGSTFNQDQVADDTDPVDFFGVGRIASGLTLHDDKTSQKITADYAAVGGTDAQGRGTITFTNTGTAVSFDPPIEAACSQDPTGTGKVRLSNFRYYFTDYSIALHYWFTFEIYNSDIDINWDWQPTLNLSFLFDNFLYGTSMGIYQDCDTSNVCTDVNAAYRYVDFTFNTADFIPLSTTIALGGTSGNNGWYTSDVTATLAAQAASCGGGAIAKTEYKVDGGGWADYTAPFVISAEGQHTVTYHSTDDLGNVEAEKTQSVWIDKTAPVITASKTPDPNVAGWYKSNVTVQFTASDVVSGVVEDSNEETLSTEGVDQSVAWTATDLAGNSATFTVSGIKIDKTAPEVTGAVTTAATGNDWYNSNVTVSFNASDALSGVVEGTHDEVLSIEGEDQSAAWTATDLAGNSATFTVSGINIDKTAPVITASKTPDPNGNGWYNTDVTVSFTASDVLSGVVDGTYKKTLLAEGMDQSVAWTVADRAGNSATFTVSGINIDKAAPEIQISSPTAVVYKNTDTPAATWSVTDALSGLKPESAEFNGSPVSNGTRLDLLLLPPGEYTLTVTASDKADNEATKSVTFTTAVDINGLIAVLGQMCDGGAITHKAACSGFKAELTAAKAGIDQGKPDRALKLLNAILLEMDALKDKAFDQAEYDLLKTDIEYVILQLQ